MGQERKKSEGTGHETLSFAEFLAKETPNTGSDRPYLVVLEPGQQQYIAPVTRNPTVIGRSANADVVLTDPTASDFHARVIKHSFGYTLEDMGSAEGTFLSDRRVTHARLVHGDTFRLGTTTFTFMGETVSHHLTDERSTKPLALVPVKTRSMGISSLPLPPTVVDHRQPIRNVQSPMGLPPISKRSDSEESEESIEDIVLKILNAYRYLRKNALLIAIFVVSGVTLGAASFRFLPPVQSAYAIITLNPAPKSNPIDVESNQEQPENATFFLGVTEALVSTSNIQTTLKQFGLTHPSDAVADDIASRVKVEPTGHNTYRATFKPKLFDRGGINPVAFLDLHIRMYIDAEITAKLKVFVAGVDFLQNQTTEAENELKRITAEMVKFREKNADLFLAQGSMLPASQSQLESHRINLAGEIARLSGELGGINRQLTRGSPLTQAKVQATQSDRDHLARVNQQITALRAQGYADGHPEVEKLLVEQKNLGLAVDEKIASKVTSLDKQSNQAYDALQAQADLLRSRLGAASSERASIEKNLRDIRKISSTSPEINAKMDELIRQKEEATRQYSVLFDRLKKAEIRLELERVTATSRYQTVIPARLESPPDKKALLLRIMLGLVLGSMLAAMALAAQYVRAIMRKVSGEPTLIGVILILTGFLSQGCVPHGNFIWVQNLTQTDTTTEPLIHPRDTILVEVQKQPTLSGEFLVRDDGHYTQPLIGSIKIAGLSTGQAALKVGTALKDVVVNPTVAVWLTKISPIKVSVVGEVKTPGTYELTRTRNVLTALAAAGWVTDFARKDDIFVIRPDNTRIRFRLRDITTSEPIAAAFRLNDADVVVVE